MVGKGKYKNVFSTIILVVFQMVVNFGFAQDNSVVFATTDTNKIRIGEPLILKIGVVTQDLKVPIKWPEFQDTISSKIDVINPGKIDTSKIGNAYKISKNINITSFEPGFHAIPPINIKVKDKDLDTEPLLLEVTTVQVDTTKAFKDIAEIYTPPFSIMEWVKENWGWIGLGTAILAGLFAWYWFVLRTKKEKEIIVKEKPTEPGDIIALKRLHQLKNEKLWQNNQLKEFYSRLSEILREYLDNQFEINALEKTTDEIMEILKRDGLNTEAKQVLFRVLFRADMVKFAKEKPMPDENESSLKHAFNFVEITKPKNVEKENTVLES